MDAFKSALAATLAFLSKNGKLDKVSYEAIEGAQVATLLKRLDAIKLELGHASELSELVQNSSLAECHKTSLIKAMSASSCKEVSQKGGKRDHQFLLSGFLNYLTQTEKEALRDDSKHAFTRCSIPVARCMKIELFMPCEKTYGHVLATLIEHFQMAGTAKEANDLLVEFKRLLRRARGDKKPSLLHYPADPREMPVNLFQAAYTDATELDAAQSANCKPGKWLRASSKDLQEMVVPFQGHGSMRGGQMNFMQQQMLMQQHLQQMQLFQQQQQQGDLNGLVLFPKKRKSLDNGNVSSPSGQSNGQGGAPLALQDIPVRNSFSLPDPGAPSSEPSTGPGEAKQETSVAATAADHEVDAHLNAMDDAFNARGDHRAALKRPASKMDQKGKGKGTKKNNKDSSKGKGSKGSKGNPKAKSNSTKGSPKGSPAKSKRPPPIPQGGPTCYYLQGKIHRSDSSQSWRTFKKAGDRCDTKIAWKGNPKAAWERALDLIEASSKK